MVGQQESGWGVGVVGAGGFAHFVRDALAGLDGLRIVAVTDVDPERARALAELDGASVHPGVDELLADPAVQVVLVATPPSTHAELALRALAAGRHVFCEKPAGLGPDEVAAVAAEVQRTGLVYVVDHVVHHDPLVQLLRRLRDDDVLGPVQRFAFDNDAGDSDLGPQHWFWRPEVSGGILLEHAVHFFDVARLLSGSPEQEVACMAHTRPDGHVDQVVATVRHADGMIATHAHSFTHANPTERQAMRVDFGLAEARLEGWIPLELRLDAWLDEAQLQALRRVAADPDALARPGFRPGPHQWLRLTLPTAPPQRLRTRDEDFPARRRVLLEAQLGNPDDKLAVYSECVRAALANLVHALRTGEPPLTGIDEGAAAVEVAHAGTLAQDGSRRPVVSNRS